jgi:hypothetical protein
MIPDMRPPAFSPSAGSALKSFVYQYQALIGAVLGLLGLVGGWYLNEYRAEKVVREHERTKIELSRVSKALTELQPKYNALQAELTSLTGKYEACTNVHGTVIHTSFFRQSLGPVKLATADALMVKLASSDLLLRLVHVTNQGAVVRIEGCEKLDLYEGRTSDQDGPNALMLPQGSEIQFQASAKCCKEGPRDCTTEDLEQFTLACRKASVTPQIAEITVKRSLIGHAGT